MNKLIKRVGIDACPLGLLRTGVANYLIELIVPLCKRNPDVEFYLFSNDEISFPNFPNVKRRVSTPKLRGALWQNIQLIEMIRKENLQVYWGTNGMLPQWGMRGIRKVVTVHDLAEIFAPSTQQFLVRWNRQLFQTMSVKRADACMAVSYATSNDMGLYYGRKADDVIHPFYAKRFEHPDQSHLDSVSLELSLPSRFWLTVGTLEPRKNLAALIRAHRTCSDGGLLMPPLLLAGGGGWLDKEIDALIKDGEARGAIRRLGYVRSDQLPALYAKCEVFLMPSLYEGFGMPILEAQMSGAAVIHGDHFSMSEAGGGIGLAVSPNQADLEGILRNLVKGEAPIACRLPDDPSIQNQAGALEKLECILGLNQ